MNYILLSAQVKAEAKVVLMFPMLLNLLWRGVNCILIGATTLNEYQKYIEKDAALERRFQPVFVPEPTVEQTIEILRGLSDKYEAHHKIKITMKQLSLLQNCLTDI